MTPDHRTAAPRAPTRTEEARQVRDVALASAAFGLLYAVLGLPFALVLRRARDGWVAALVDAAVLGLVVLPLGVSLWAWWGIAGAAVSVAAWLAALLAVVRRGRPGLPVPPGRATAPTAVLAVGWVAVLGGAALLRLREVNFLPWVGDMGAYVNWANEFARTGTLDAGWPPYFSAFLAVASWAFGPEHTTIGMASVGLVLLLAVARLLQQIGTGRWVVLAAGLLMATHLHFVWFATFPVSESLTAPLLVAWLLLVHRALAGEGTAVQVLGSGVFMLATVLLRANGPLLLVPLVLVLLATLAVRSWRRWSETLAWIVAGGVAASALGYWYGISQISRYYVDTQLPEFLPLGLRLRLDDLGVFDPTLGTALLAVAATVVGAGLVVLVGAWVTRRHSRAADLSGSRRPGQVGVVLAVAVVLVVVLAVLAVDDGDAWRILQRMGWWLALLAVIGAGSARWWPDEAARPLLLMVAAIVLLYLVFQDARLGEPREHSFFLYWDRYLFSEVLPGLVVLAAVGTHQLLRELAAALTAARLPEAAGGVVVGVVAVGASAAATAWALPQLDRADDEVSMRGAYELTAGLAELADAQDAPVLWSASGDAEVADYFFPNTWMALARPLDYTFGVDVLNLDRWSDFAPDETVTADQVRRAASCEAVPSITVLEVATGGEHLDARLAGSGLQVSETGVRDGSLQRLAQTSSPEDWVTTYFHVTSWEVVVPDSLLITAPICDLDAWTSGVAGSRMLVQ